MTTNLKQFIAAGFERLHYTAIGSDGYAKGVTATLANGADSGSGKLEEVKTFNLNLPEPERVNVTGDDGLSGVFLFPSNASPEFSLEAAAFDLGFDALAQKTVNYTIGDWDIASYMPDDPDYQQMALVAIARAKSNASGSIGNEGFVICLIPRGQVAPLGPSNVQERSAHANRYTVVGSRADTFPWGEALTTGNQGTTAAAFFMWWSENRWTLHSFTGDNSTDDVVLDFTPAAATGDKVVVWVDGTKLTYTTAYTVNTSTKTVTFEAASVPTAGAKVVIGYEYTL